MKAGDSDALYTERIIALARQISGPFPLQKYDLSHRVVSALCGSWVEVEIACSPENPKRVQAFGCRFETCVLGQAAICIVRRSIVGQEFSDILKVCAQTIAMVETNGPEPPPPWQDLAVLKAVRPYRPRHSSALLVFRALEGALRG